MSAAVNFSGDPGGDLRHRHTSQNVESDVSRSEHDNPVAESKPRKTFGRTPDGTGEYDISRRALV